MTPETEDALSSAARGNDPRRALRWAVYTLLIAVAAGNLIGRILAVNSVDRIVVENDRVKRELASREKELKAQGLDATKLAERLKAAETEIRDNYSLQRPFLSGNDRSRWDTVRALVEHGTYAIDDILSEPNWDTIDMVAHRDREGQMHLYSSKPPLLATIVAGEYWLIHKITGETLSAHPYSLGRCMLVTINVLPLLLYFWLIARMAERYGATDWGRLFVVAAACFGTFLSTFAVVFNNHLPAAISMAIALYAALRIWYDGERRLRYFALAGFFAAFTVPDDLPSLSMFGLLSVGLLWKAPRQTLLGYAPATLVVAAAFFGTNYLANGSWLPGYFHRSTARSADNNFAGAPSAGSSADATAAESKAAQASDNWYDYQYYRRLSDGKVFAEYPEPGSIDTKKYRVIESYWRHPAGIDRGEQDGAKYALHALVGHHGIFSLTPIWLLCIPGVFLLARRRGERLTALAGLIATVSLVCIAFYLLRPPIDRNYGGMTSGFRWVFWMAPLWLLACLPAADALSNTRWKRWLCCLLLLLSVLSASYPTWNPWTLPWLANFWNYLGWS